MSRKRKRKSKPQPATPKPIRPAFYGIARVLRKRKATGGKVVTEYLAAA
jgi:hypothetical protein